MKDFNDPSEPEAGDAASATADARPDEAETPQRSLGAHGDKGASGGLRRRDFLQQGAVAALGVGALGGVALPGVGALAAPAEARVRRRVKLGRTGLEIPDISFGTGGTSDPDLITYALDRGMTYFDTAESYPLKRPGEAEKAIGVALKGKRDRVLLASKQVTRLGDRWPKMMERLEGSLHRLATDRIEVYFNHAVNDVARMKSPEWAEFISRAKQQGKIRFSGISGHGGRLQQALRYSLENDLVDVILAAYNFGQDPAFYEKFTRSFDFVANQAGLPDVLETAHRKGIGVIAMKTLMGARLNDMRPYERGDGQFSHAAFRWALSNPNVDALIVSMKSRAQIDEYLAVSGDTSLQKSDLRLLDRYAAINGSTQCRPACGACLDSCPNGVAIDDVLRARMYARDYEDPEKGRAAYLSLADGASACQSCTSLACASSCDHGLDVPGLTRSTPGVLGLG